VKQDILMKIAEASVQEMPDIPWILALSQSKAKKD